MGPEEITISHLVTRHKSHEVEVDRFTVQTERFLKENGIFLRGCNVAIDEGNVHLSLVGFNGATWERVEENLETVESPIRTNPTPLSIRGDELVGNQLNRLLQNIATGRSSANTEKSVLWYTPKVEASVSLDMKLGKKETITVGDHLIAGTWVSALRRGTERVVVKVFVGVDGRTYVEKYPSLHQARTLTNNGFSNPTAYTDPYRGLFSDAYLGFADGATDAVYHIVSSQPLSLDEFAFIAEPDNQTLKQLDDHTLELKVTAGGPDGDDPPTDDDLSSTKYINTNTRTIRDAFLYLKSASKRGSLPAHRCDNAVPIIAKAERIRNPKIFWNDSEKAARLIAEYVHAILPVKQQTHTMQDAVSTLKNGNGDCTEHSVLFASLMRAAGIPTRLVSGMYLTHGGAWVFHMWNEYWDGEKWHSIDSAVGPKMNTGANYVALSRGASNFADHRNNISFFLDKSYSGLAINMVSAGANGESLHLAKPRREAPAGHDAVIVQALTLSRRGDFAGAYELVSRYYDEVSSPLDLALLRMDLLFRTHHYEEALVAIRRLRERTSLPANIFMMDKLEFDIHIARRANGDAAHVLNQMADYLDENGSLFLQMQALLHISRGEISAGMAIIENALLAEPNDTMLMTTYLTIAADHLQHISSETRQQAVQLAWQALYLTHYASPEALKSVAALFYHLGEVQKALPLIEHALIMTPNDADLVAWHEAVRKRCW